MKQRTVSLVFSCILLCLLGCVIENKSARDFNRDDMGMVSSDGGIECSNVCAPDGCENGTPRLDELCRCVCEEDCSAIVCDDCPAGQVAVERLGSCCPSCEPGCRTNEDCSDDTICTDGVCVADCSLVDCARCPDGYITDSDPTSCCDCTPACGPSSPFSCNEGERCQDGICLEVDTCGDIACEGCPPGTQPIDVGGCCPDCEPIPCSCPDTEAPVCAEGVTYGNSCLAECDGFTDYRPGACDESICGDEPNCGSTCDMVIECFDRECDTVNGRDFLVDGCRQACRESGGAISDILCQLNSCEEVVDSVTELADANFCGGALDCDNPPPNVEYVEYGDDCDTIRFECPLGAEYYRDECGCGCRFRGDSCEDFPPDGGYYVGIGDECDFIDFDCGDGEDYFNDECGCGCVNRDCGCPNFDAPVCAPDGTQYRNDCEAQCAGEFGARPCEMACVCPEVYDPVCGLDSQTYDNACFADCVDVPIVHEGACFETDLCPNGFASSCAEVCDVAVGCYQEYCSEEEASLIATECLNVCGSDGFPLQDIICSFESCEDVVGFLGPITENPNACSVERQDCPDARTSVYYAEDPETCNLISFECEEGSVPFDNVCGCGCTADLECPEEGREARYISRDTEICERITLDCPVGSEAFSDECGCGCLF